MRKIIGCWCAVALVLAAGGGSLSAHHSLTNFDTTKAVRVKGTVVQFNMINPHSILYVEETGADGAIHRWAVEGPAVNQLTRQGYRADVLKPGDVVEVCGYLPKEPIVYQVAHPETGARSLSGRLLNGETLVMADGKERSWGDYGAHKCFAPGYTDHHAK